MTRQIKQILAQLADYVQQRMCEDDIDSAALDGVDMKAPAFDIAFRHGLVTAYHDVLHRIWDAEDEADDPVVREEAREVLANTRQVDLEAAIAILIWLLSAPIDEGTGRRLNTLEAVLVSHKEERNPRAVVLPVEAYNALVAAIAVEAVEPAERYHPLRARTTVQDAPRACGGQQRTRISLMGLLRGLKRRLRA